MASASNYPSLKPLLALFALCVFSYVPTWQFGMVSGTHIDISLLYLALLGTVLWYTPMLWNRRLLVWSYPAVKWLMMFQAYATLSLLWSPNLARGILTVGFGWLLTLSVCIVIINKNQISTQRQVFEKWVSGAIAVSLAFALWQLLSDALHLPSWATLLPAAYSGDVFGFARPTAFSLEPQFFGSILLAPYLLVLHRTLISTSRTNVLWLLMLGSMLVLTLSRGVLLAATVGSLLLLASHLHQRKNILPALGIASSSVVIGFFGIFAFASVRAGSLEKGAQSTRASIEHLTLGIIRFKTPIVPATQFPPANTPTYVQSSTDSRISMSTLALKMWQSSPIFGVGSGGFGMATHKLSPTYTTSSVVNNYYLELLAELGIIGAGLFAGFVLSLLIGSIRHRYLIFVTTVVAVLVQWMFFSGNANVIHVWLLFGLVATFTGFVAKKR